MILSDYRKRLDDIDDQLLRILNQRAQIVLEVARMKAENNMPYRDYRREEELINRAVKRNAGPLLNAHVEGIFDLILEISAAIVESQ